MGLPAACMSWFKRMYPEKEHLATRAECHSLCAVSGTVPEEPVVSTKTGHVFEKRLIEKHIKVCACLE